MANEIQDREVNQIIDTVKSAVADRTALKITGGNSKDFYGNPVKGDTLNTSGYHGIVNYEPTELVVTARCGTCLSDLEETLAEQQQMLPFEPPYFSETATVGGMVACGLSGPRRPYAGSVRDYVLGVRCINGKAEDLHFGGQVMKNVAGFDVSRLMTGSLGTLGVILETSFKLLPKPETELTLQIDVDQQEAIRLMNYWSAKPLPISAACYEKNDDHARLLLRLSGVESAISAAHNKIGGEPIINSAGFWRDLKEHRHTFFSGESPLWRLSVPTTTEPLTLEGGQLIDWGGAQRWLRSEEDESVIREQAIKNGGHATLFRAAKHQYEVERFSPLSPALMTIHKRLKTSFDPLDIFNPGRLYTEL